MPLTGKLLTLSRMKFNWRRTSRSLHRDLGYFFFGMSVVYALSGLAMNHARDWNPDYIVRSETLTLSTPFPEGRVSKDAAKELLDEMGIDKAYRQHFSPKDGELKIFFDGGTAVVERDSGTAQIEALERRPVFHLFNRLHRNPTRAWTWFADLFCLSLLIISVTGLLILPGKNGITRKGGLLTLAGILVPALIVIISL